MKISYHFNPTLDNNQGKTIDQILSSICSFICHLSILTILGEIMRNPYCFLTFYEITSIGLLTRYLIELNFRHSLLQMKMRWNVCYGLKSKRNAGCAGEHPLLFIVWNIEIQIAMGWTIRNKNQIVNDFFDRSRNCYTSHNFLFFIFTGIKMMMMWPLLGSLSKKHVPLCLEIIFLGWGISVTPQCFIIRLCCDTVDLQQKNCCSYNLPLTILRFR